MLTQVLGFMNYFKSKERQDRITTKIKDLIEEKAANDIDKLTDIDHLIKSLRRNEFILKALLGEENYLLMENYKKPILIEYQNKNNVNFFFLIF